MLCISKKKHFNSTWQFLCYFNVLLSEQYCLAKENKRTLKPRAIATFTAKREMADNCTIFCANLSSRVTEELLYELFLQAGPIAVVKIPKDANGDQRPFGFVEYKHECSVDYAIELFKDTFLFGKELQLKHRNKNQDSSPGNVNMRMKRQASLPNMHHITAGMIPRLPQPNFVNMMTPPFHPFMANQGLIAPPIFPIMCPPFIGVNMPMPMVPMPMMPMQDQRNMSFPEQTNRLGRNHSERGYRHDHQTEDNRLRNADVRRDSERHDSGGLERQHRRSRSDYHDRRRSRSRSRSRSRERSRRHDDRHYDRHKRFESDRELRRQEGPSRY